VTRKRTARRAAERSARKLEDARLKLALLGEGFSADHPIAVDSASQIEPHARSLRCPVDDTPFQVLEHDARRVVRVQCKQCGRRFDLHFALRRAN
jgi:hypothetical protein